MSKRQTVYTYNGNGYDPSDIVCQLYGDAAWRTICIPQEDLENIAPWKLANELNRAYEQGRKEAFEDLRRLIGVKDGS